MDYEVKEYRVYFKEDGKGWDYVTEPTEEKAVIRANYFKVVRKYQVEVNKVLRMVLV